MGSAKNAKPLASNGIRLIDGQDTVPRVTDPVTGAAIEKLVSHLRFANPQAAAQFLASNPGFLGQVSLLPALRNHLQ